MATSTRNTPSHIDGNATRTHLSTNIIIKVANNVVGAVQKLSINEERSLRFIDEVGTDGHIDGTPSKSTNIGGSCDRIRFDRARIAEAFSRGFVHVHAQRYPFDIEIHDVFADSDVSNALVTVIEGVWIKNIKTDYSATEFVISDSMSWEAERIYSFMKGNKNVVQAVSNVGIIKINEYEQQADVGKYTGALDAAGLLRQFVDGTYGS